MKKILALLASAVLVLSFSACDSSEALSEKPAACGMLYETGSPYLYYDKNTQIVYMLCRKTEGYGANTRSYAFITPYYGSNGLPCKYIDGEIVEYKESVSGDVMS